MHQKVEKTHRLYADVNKSSRLFICEVHKSRDQNKVTTRQHVFFRKIITEKFEGCNFVLTRRAIMKKCGD